MKVWVVPKLRFCPLGLYDPDPTYGVLSAHQVNEPDSLIMPLPGDFFSMLNTMMTYFFSIRAIYDPEIQDSGNLGFHSKLTIII